MRSNKQVKIRVVNGEVDAGATALSGVFEQEKTLTSNSDGTIKIMVRAVKVGIDFDDLYKVDVYVNDLKTEVRDIFPPEATVFK